MTTESKVTLTRVVVSAIIGALTMLVAVTTWKTKQDALPQKIEHNATVNDRQDVDINGLKSDFREMKTDIEWIKKAAERIEGKLR